MGKITAKINSIREGGGGGFKAFPGSFITGKFSSG